jgi:hypothetical protein
MSLGRLKTACVAFETVRCGERVHGYELITIFPDQGETFESMFKDVCSPEFVYKEVFERRDDAVAWVSNRNLNAGGV